MRRGSRLLVVGVLAAALSGCWPAPGAGPDRRNWNPYERIVTPGNAGRLTERFRIPLTDGTGPPVVTPSGLFVRTGPSIAAFAAGTGEHRWTARVLPDDTGPYEPETGDPFVVDSRGEVLASYAVFGASHTRHNFLATLSAGTGARQETYLPGQLHAMRGSAVAVVHHEQCCFGEVDYTRIHVGDPSEDVADWTWGGQATELSGGTLTLGVGRLFAVLGDRVFAYDLATPCQPLPPERPQGCLSDWSVSIGAGVTPVVVGADATVHIGSGDGRVYAIDAGTGGIRWSADVGAAVSEPPALTGDALYVATNDGRLSAVPAGGCGLPACPVSWTTSTTSEITVQPAVAGDVVYIGSADGTVRAYDAGGCGEPICSPRWSVDTGAPVTGGLAVYGGHLYVGTQDSLIGYGLPPG